MPQRRGEDMAARDISGERVNVVNLHERTVYRDVREVAAHHGASVHLNTKLSDLADPHDAGPLFDWATRAHVDLLVRDDDDAMAPLFAIEIDGMQHATEERQARRDRVKDDLLQRAGIDVLRVTTGTTSLRHGRDRLAGYLADLWFSSRAFDEAQEEGLVDPYESFFHPFTFRVDQATGRMASLDPAMPFRARLQRDHQRDGKPTVWIPTAFYRRRPHVGRVGALVVIALTEQQFISAEAEIGHFRITGVQPTDVAEEVALLELSLLYRQWRNGEAVARHVRELTRVLPERCARLTAERGDEWYATGHSSIMRDWMASIVGSERVAAVYPSP